MVDGAGHGSNEIAMCSAIRNQWIGVHLADELARKSARLINLVSLGGQRRADKRNPGGSTCSALANHVQQTGEGEEMFHAADQIF
jgi:hypothetical protein